MASLQNADVSRVFTRWAPFYDATHFRLPGRPQAIAALALEPGERVLDVGCGTGLALARLRHGVGPQGAVVGVDLVPAMLQRAQARVNRYKWANVQVQQGDAAALPFPDSSFDAALAAHTLHIIPAYEKAIQEVHRVLRPGGRFAVAEVALSGARNAAWQRVLHVCAFDAGHDVEGALRAVFSRVEVQRVWGGLGVVAVCAK